MAKSRTPKLDVDSSNPGWTTTFDPALCFGLSLPYVIAFLLDHYTAHRKLTVQLGEDYADPTPAPKKKTKDHLRQPHPSIDIMTIFHSY